MDDFHVLDTYRFILSSLRALLFVVDCCRLVCVCVDVEGARGETRSFDVCKFGNLSS